MYNNMQLETLSIAELLQTGNMHKLPGTNLASVVYACGFNFVWIGVAYCVAPVGP